LPDCKLLRYRLPPVNILSFLQHRSTKRAKRLYDDARALVDAGKNEQALAIARRLRKVHWSGAFEIEGLAYSHLGRHEDAVRVLKEGLKLAPGVWLNWHLLASCLSDLGRFEEALAAYERAEECEGADRNSVDLNRAIVAMRMDDFARALELLDSPMAFDSEAMRLRAVECRVTSLFKLGRVSEAEEIAAHELEAWRASEHDGEPPYDIGEMALTLGRIRMDRGEDHGPLLEQTLEWWRITRHERLLWLIRELLSLHSPEAQYFQLVLHGRIPPEWHAEAAAQGFWTAADAVADTPQEAVTFIAQLHGLGPGIEWIIDEAEAVEPRPDDPKGVYAARNLVYYNEASSEK
jgi:Flp pilus assembly protein TadD